MSGVKVEIDQTNFGYYHSIVTEYGYTNVLKIPANILSILAPGLSFTLAFRYQNHTIQEHYTYMYSVTKSKGQKLRIHVVHNNTESIV